MDDSNIDDNETLYRKIPISTDWYDLNQGTLSPQTFSPRKEDITGLSFSRSKFRTAAEAGRGMSSQGYYVVELRVGDLRKLGLSVKYCPETPAGYDPSHVEIPELNAEDRKSERCLNFQEQLSSMSTIVHIHGPFTPVIDPASD